MAGEYRKQYDKPSTFMRGIYFFCRLHAKSCTLFLVVSVLFISVAFSSFENIFFNATLGRSYQTLIRTQLRPRNTALYKTYLTMQHTHLLPVNTTLYKSYQTPQLTHLRPTNRNRTKPSSKDGYTLEKGALYSHRSKKLPVNYFAKRVGQHISHLPPRDLHKISSPKNFIYRNPGSAANFTEKRNFSHLPKEMKLLRPKLFKDAPRQFIRDFKNPCYYGTYGSLECLPYFFLLGHPKCGTTDIWSKINAHPEIGNSRKEPHWWSRGSLNYTSYPLSFYETTFTTKAMVKMLREKKRANKSTAITGDGSASTFWDNEMWESFYQESREVGPPYVTADVIHAILPNSKLLVSFRDPTTRLYSGYIFFNMKRKIQVSPKAFHSKVVSELESFKKCTLLRSVRACAYSTTHEKVRIRVGLYSVYTKDWLVRFPPGQFMFLKLEEWASKCTDILPEIYRFLEVSTLSSSRIQEICSWKKRNDNQRNVQAVGPMFNKTRELLRNFYRPFVLDLAKTLNDTRFLWDYLDD